MISHRSVGAAAITFAEISFFLQIAVIALPESDELQARTPSEFSHTPDPNPGHFLKDDPATMFRAVKTNGDGVSRSEYLAHAAGSARGAVLPLNGNTDEARRASSQAAGKGAKRGLLRARVSTSRPLSRIGAEAHPQVAQSGKARTTAKSLSAMGRRRLQSQSSLLTCATEEGLTLCMDSPRNWEDTDGNSCDDYARNSYCTVTGDVGPGLDSPDAALEQLAGADGLNAADVCCACGAGNGVLRIGIVLGFSTSWGTMLPEDYGAGALGAVLLALREINADTAILPGYELLFAMQDSKCNRTVATAMTKSLLQEWGADVIIGASCSSASLGVQEVLDIVGVPEISGSATSTSLTSYGYFLRSIPSDEYQAAAMADLVHYYNWTRVATVAVDDDYGLRGIAAFHNAAELRGITVAHRLTYPVATEDLSEVVAGLQQSRAYIIVVFAHDVEIGQLMEQAYAAGVGGEGYVWIGSRTSDTLWEAMSSQLSEQQKSNIMRGYLGPVPYINKSTPEYMAFAERWAAQPATVDEATGECSDEVDDAGSPIWRRYDVDHNTTTFDACIGLNYSDAKNISLFAAYYYDAAYVMASRIINFY
ncbi:hypothetical protein CYMTET_42406 [Cymbomonas tetramitiformis]|uniref:Receptor ligand binding region domain-containing protein n=1 Tax=Cymbomonas tetramitiformis TaxID=36881 RepID=A0AAE0C6A7_9CHLO|nr:hypothetical protein CYMTET_42406 [Cymbomonas tetramitiformis]